MKITNEQLFQLHERSYFWELEQRNQINGRMSVFMVMILAAASLAAYIIEHLFPIKIAPLPCLCAVTLMISLFAIGLAAIHLVRTWHNMTYDQLPTPAALEKQRMEFITYCNDVSKPESEVRSWENEMATELFDLFVTCSTTARGLNKKKAARLRKATKWLLIAVAFGMLSFIFLKLSAGILMKQPSCL